MEKEAIKWIIIMILSVIILSGVVYYFQRKVLFSIGAGLGLFIFFMVIYMEKTKRRNG